jgi:hypothetical protein
VQNSLSFGEYPREATKNGRYSAAGIWNGTNSLTKAAEEQARHASGSGAWWCMVGEPRIKKFRSTRPFSRKTNYIYFDKLSNMNIMLKNQLEQYIPSTTCASDALPPLLLDLEPASLSLSVSLSVPVQLFFGRQGAAKNIKSC